MKTALIAGVCLLVLAVTVTDALQKKQDVDCFNLDNDVQACLDASDVTSIDTDTLHVHR